MIYRLYLFIVVIQIHIIHIHIIPYTYINNVCLRDSRFIGWGLSYFVQWWIIVMVFTEHLHWWTSWLPQWAVFREPESWPIPNHHMIAASECQLEGIQLIIWTTIWTISHFGLLQTTEQTANEARIVIPTMASLTLRPMPHLVLSQM